MNERKEIGFEPHVEVTVPPRASGVVVVARSNGNGLPHQISFPDVLLGAGLAVALCDVLTPRERQTALETHRAARNVRVLRDRLTAIIDCVRQRPDTATLPLGLVAAGTLAAAAIDAASLRPLDVDAIVCRNGRLDLATGVEHVQSPTLLLVATDKPQLIRINDEAFGRLECEKRYDVIPTGITAPEDARAYRLCAELARNWLLSRLHIPVAA